MMIGTCKLQVGGTTDGIKGFRTSWRDHHLDPLRLHAHLLRKNLMIQHFDKNKLENNLYFINWNNESLHNKEKTTYLNVSKQITIISKLNMVKRAHETWWPNHRWEISCFVFHRTGDLASISSHLDGTFLHHSP